MSVSLSRRRFLGSAGAGVAAAMYAGVMPSVGRAVMAQDGGAEFHAAYPYLDPGAGGHFNTFVTNAILTPLNPTQVYGDLILPPLGMYYWASGEWLPLLATEWAFISSASGEAASASPVAGVSASPAAGGIDVNADTFEVKLREDVVWSDDTPFTAQDVVDTLWVRRLMAGTEWKYIDDAVAVDDYTVRCHMHFPSTEVERYIIRVAYPRPSSVYGEWAQQARDLFQGGMTLDDPEGKQLLDQFTQFRPDGDYPVTGPFRIDVDSITNAQMTLVKNDKGLNADQVLFDRIINYNGETDTISAVVLSGDVDYATHGFSVATENQMAENGIRVVRPPTYGGAGLYMNFGRHPELLDKRVRQALAHAIDRAQTGTIALGESGVAQQYMTGMSDNKVPQWLDEEAVNGLNQYAYDQEAAAALLEEAGWTKDGDIWLKPDGSEAVYELMFHAEFADYSAAGQDVSEQLTAFGIQIEPRAITHTQVAIDMNQGNYSFATQTWGSTNNPHPHYDYEQSLLRFNTLAIRDGGQGMQFPLVQETEVAGEVDLEQLTVESAEGLDVQAQRDNVTTIAQVFNELVPVIPLFERYGNNAALEGVRVAEWPADDHPIWQNSPYADGIPVMLMYTGELQPFEG